MPNASRIPVTGSYLSFVQPTLLTWNVFFSASAYERGEVGGWPAVEDLVSVVDALCLHDTVAVLGDPRRRPFASHDSEFFDAKRRSGALAVETLNEASKIRAAEAARKRAVLFFGRRHLRKLESWIAEALHAQ